MKKTILFFAIFSLIFIDLSYATELKISQFKKLTQTTQKYNYTIISQCDKVLINPYMRICYSYKYRMPKFNFYKLNYKLLNKNLKKRLTFRNDKRISFGYTSVKSFTHSGFDKGHLAPDAAYDFDIKILRFTYLNSNILPEVPYLNRYIISKIEKNFRDEAIKNQKNALIITGGINFKYNSDLNFYVPEQIFKILIINKIRSIYIFPNTKEYWEKWKIKRKKDLKEIPLNDLLKVFKKDISIRTLNKLGIKFIKRRIK